MGSYQSRYIGVDRLPRTLPDCDLDLYFRLPADSVLAIKARFAADRLPNVESRMVAVAAQVVFVLATGRMLDRVELLPKSLLRSLGIALGVSAPAIASLRSIYKRRETAFEHQKWARDHLGIQPASKSTSAELASVLSAQAGAVATVDELVTAGMHWLFDQKILISSERVIRDLAREAFAAVEGDILKAIKAAVPAERRKACIKALFEVRQPGGGTVLEWLRTPPRKHSPSTLAETSKKIEYLKGLGAATWNLNKVTLERQKIYARAIAGRPPSDSKRLKEDTQVLEAICFLRTMLLELTDSYLHQVARRVSDLTRRANDKTLSRQGVGAAAYRKGLGDIKQILEDKDRTSDQRCEAISNVIGTLGDFSPVSHASVVRAALTDDAVRVRSLLSLISTIEFKGLPDATALKQLEILRALHASGATELPSDTEVTVDKVWRGMVDGDDRKKAMRALEASTALALRAGLRRGSIWVDHSLTFRERDQMLIPPDEWKRTKTKYIRALKLPAKPDKFLASLEKVIATGLTALAEAAEAGEVTLDANGTIHLPAMEAQPEDIEPKRALDHMFALIGDVQFPDLILEMDSLTNFSGILLGRRATSEHELIALYAALIAHGTETDAKGVAAMTPQLDPAHVATAMRALEYPGRLRLANQRVNEFQKSHEITRLWGRGTLGSSDMMSVDASRNLWNARIDPRRRTYAVGLYTHVLDQHSIIYDQAIVLNTRQDGPAIEGVVRYNQATEDTPLTRLAVDTHGYTNVGMTIAKSQGFDLCPQLRNLKERKMFLTRAIAIPEGLDGLVAGRVSLKTIRVGWDDLLRVGASIMSGRVSASVMTVRLGSAAKSDPIHKAADHLGRLLRTVFLCDYFTNAEFRREIHTVLNRGESVHQLQRTVYSGKIAADRGRRRDELMAISGSHTLLTNLVLAWNTHHMQAVVDRWRKSGTTVEDTWIARMGPAHSSHINFRGLFRFGIEKYRAMLLKPAARERKRG